MIELASLLQEDGRIVLSFDPGHERRALVAGSMLADILREGVRSHSSAGPEPRLSVHVGEETRERHASHPQLVVRTPAVETDTRVAFDHEPWAACSPVHLPSLGWAATIPGEPVLTSDRGPILSRRGDRWYLNADLTGVFGREVTRHATADGDVRALLASVLVLRAALGRIGLLADEPGRAISLLTVDAEDQQRYFVNRRSVCSNIRGKPTDDLQFANSCRTIMSRCQSLGLKAIFMVTGDELDPSFTDAFGDRLIGLEDNRGVLQEIEARGHDVACHGFDHEWWISKGHAAIRPMTMWQKLTYFARTSGDVRTLFGLAGFLLRNARLLRRARAAKHERELARNTPFTYAEVESDLARWMELVGFDEQELFIRYPGYVRSSETLACLDDKFGAVVDSSDLYELDDNLPSFPYRLLAERGGRMRRTNVTEIPCLWIDELLRTRKQVRVGTMLDRLKALAAFPGSVLSFVTHTKVLGAAYGHCHVYLHDPLRGLALPMVQESWERFGRFLATHTDSTNWRDLRQAVLGVPA